MDLAGWVVATVARLGLLGVAALVALENLVPPIPSEVVLPMAGFAVTTGAFSFWGVVVAATLGSLAGALAIYALGRRVGEERVRAWMDRHGKWLLLDARDVDKASAWFARHGRWAVLLGRLAPGVRSYVSFPAGFARMPLARFGALTLVGSAAWNVALVWVGMQLGASWQRVEPYLDAAGWAVWIAIGALLAAVIARRWRRRTQGARGAA